MKTLLELSKYWLAGLGLWLFNRLRFVLTLAGIVTTSWVWFAHGTWAGVAVLFINLFVWSLLKMADMSQEAKTDGAGTKGNPNPSPKQGG